MVLCTSDKTHTGVHVEFLFYLFIFNAVVHAIGLLGLVYIRVAGPITYAAEYEGKGVEGKVINNIYWALVLVLAAQHFMWA